LERDRETLFCLRDLRVSVVEFSWMPTLRCVAGLRAADGAKIRGAGMTKA